MVIEAAQIRLIAHMPRPAARVTQRLQELESYGDSAHRPYIHLVDGAVSDNLGLRGVRELIEGFEACTRWASRHRSITCAGSSSSWSILCPPRRPIGTSRRIRR